MCSGGRLGRNSLTKVRVGGVRLYLYRQPPAQFTRRGGRMLSEYQLQLAPADIGSAAGRIDLLAPTRVGLSASPIYVARIPAAPFAVANIRHQTSDMLHSAS